MLASGMIASSRVESLGSVHQNIRSATVHYAPVPVSQSLPLTSARVLPAKVATPTRSAQNLMAKVSTSQPRKNMIPKLQLPVRNAATQPDLSVTVQTSMKKAQSPHMETPLQTINQKSIAREVQVKQATAAVHEKVAIEADTVQKVAEDPKAIDSVKVMGETEMVAAEMLAEDSEAMQLMDEKATEDVIVMDFPGNPDLVAVGRVEEKDMESETLGEQAGELIAAIVAEEKEKDSEALQEHGAELMASCQIAQVVVPEKVVTTESPSEISSENTASRLLEKPHRNTTCMQGCIEWMSFKRP